MRLKSVWASAARSALREEPMQAMSAVTVVPMFEPRTSATAGGKAIAPAPASPITRKPGSDVAWKKPSASRICGISRIGAKPAFRSSSPKKSIPRPIVAIAALRTFSRFEKR